MRQFSYIVPAACEGMSVNAFARGHAGMSMRFVRSVKFLPEGIMVNGQHVTTRAVLHAGDEIIFTVPDEQNACVVPAPGQVRILWENEDLVLVDKAAGVVVHPCHGHYEDTLLNHLAWHYQSLQQPALLRPVGRLDKDTSGLIFIAKNRYAVREMEKQRESGSLKRVYLAIVEGCPGNPGDQGIIDRPIGPVPGDKNLYQVCDGGRPSRTAYEVLAVRDFTEGGERVTASLLRLRLESGRTHQIRVHMASMGHPLVGDPFYGRAHLLGMDRAALHSSQICCHLPVDGQFKVFETPLPEDMKRLFPL